MIEARDEKQLLRFQKRLASYKLLIIDELGFVPLPKTGAELLFEVFSQRYERGSILVTSNLPFDEWTEVFGSERLTGALLDRLTHHVHILGMNGESYRLNQSRQASRPRPPSEPTTQPTLDPVGPQGPPARAAASACRGHAASRAGPARGLRGQARSRQVVPSYTAEVVPFCSAIDRSTGTSHAASLRVTQALHEAARVPPMDYRDNPPTPRTA